VFTHQQAYPLEQLGVAAEALTADPNSKPGTSTAATSTRRTRALVDVVIDIDFSPRPFPAVAI